MLTDRDNFKKGRLVVQLKKEHKRQPAPTGLHPVGLSNKRDGLLYFPLNYNPAQPSALAVLLHGAGGSADHGLWLLKSLADAANIILLAPDARNTRSWDIISNEQFGPDVIFINQALEQVLARYAVNTLRLAIGGFSDGASYALSLGLINGDLFTHVIAFSPGFAYAAAAYGAPRLFVSHGVRDEVLPINACSRRLVPRLQKLGYDITYREFDGEHTVPDKIKNEAVQWFLNQQ